MRRAASLLILLLLCLVGGLAFLLLASVRTGEIFVDLPSGTSARAMASMLRSSGVIRSGTAFLFLRLVKGGHLKAGEYRFSGAASTLTVYERLQRGDVYTRSVSIPEGYNLFDIARVVEASGIASANTFMEAARANTDLIAVWAPHALSLEGFLYPDTYRFSRHTTPRAMQETMVKRFRAAAAKLGLSSDVYRTVTLASLVEKEVRYDEERYEAAGVFTNRLQRGMPLQTDPSVIYAALLSNRWTGAIHQSDLHFDSPYNTYVHAGLPPGPICSPGMAALTAAMHPATTGSVYFVADVNGHTVFSKSLKEHAQNVAAYRRNLPSSAQP